MQYKSVIVGIGNVGQSIAQQMYERRLGDIACFGRKLTKIEPRVLEIRQSHKGKGYSISASNNPNCFNGADLVVITAGAPRTESQTRDDLAQNNAPIVEEVAGYIAEYAPNAVVVVVTNPVAAMSAVVKAKTGFPRERILGVGNELDAGRESGAIAQVLNLASSDIRVTAIGDHGESMTIPREYIFVGPFPLEQYLCRRHNKGECDIIVGKVNEIIHSMKKASQPLVVGLGQSPWLGPGAYIADVCESILLGPSLATALVQLSGQYGIGDVFFGTPVVVGPRGIIEVLELPLSPESLAEVKVAAAHIEGITRVAFQAVSLE